MWYSINVCVLECVRTHPPVPSVRTCAWKPEERCLGMSDRVTETPIKSNDSFSSSLSFSHPLTDAQFWPRTRALRLYLHVMTIFHQSACLKSCRLKMTNIYKLVPHEFPGESGRESINLTTNDGDRREHVSRNSCLTA